MIASGKIQFITDPRDDCDPLEQVEMVCSAGIRWVQMRLKDYSRAEKCRLGTEMAAVCRRHGAVFIVNDDVDIAVETGADGVHLGLEDEEPEEARKVLGSSALIGGTCNTMADIRLRAMQGVDYIGLGPYRFTTTKKKLSPVLGLQGYEEILRQCSEERIDLPIVAIGGIRTEDINPLQTAGVFGIAISSLILDAADPRQRIREIQEKMA